MRNGEAYVMIREMWLISCAGNGKCGKHLETIDKEAQMVVVKTIWGFPCGAVVKNPLANAGDARDAGSIPGSGRSSGRGHDNPLQKSCLENLIDRVAWWGVVNRVAKSWTRLK